MNIVAAASGTAKKQAGTGEGQSIVMPAIKKVKAGETATFTGYVNGSEKVHALANNGTMGDKYTRGTGQNVPNESQYSITDAGEFTPPTAPGVTQYIVEYNRTVTDGVAIYNRADKFPGTVKLILKVLAIEPCSADVLRAGYLVLPSFQVSPEVSLGLTTDSTIDYTGDLQVSKLAS